MTIEQIKNTGPVIASREEGAEHEEEIVESTTSDSQTKITIYRHFCKGCEICAEVCPKGVLRMTLAPDRWEGAIVEIVDVDSCNACMLCEHQCPDFAIEVRNVMKEAKKAEKRASA